MSPRACRYIDIPDVDDDILVLGADAIIAGGTVGHFEDLQWERIAKELDAGLTAHQLADLAMWVATMFPEPGLRSELHDPFLEGGVEFALRFPAAAQPVTTWRRMQRSQGAFEQQITLLGVRHSASAADLVVIDVLRCRVVAPAGCETWGQAWEKSELGMIGLSNALHGKMAVADKILIAREADWDYGVMRRLRSWRCAALLAAI